MHKLKQKYEQLIYRFITNELVNTLLCSERMMASPVFHYQDWLGCVVHALPGNSHYREDALTIHGSQPPWE